MVHLSKANTSGLISVAICCGSFVILTGLGGMCRCVTREQLKIGELGEPL